MPSPAYERVEHRLRGEVLAHYGTLGDVAFAFAAGSLIEGLADEADLDLTIVWRDGPPTAEGRLPITIDSVPPPSTFEQANFNLDRFFIDGQQVDAKHVDHGTFERWVHEVEHGGGTSGYPMPIIVMHALTSGIVLHDQHGVAGQYVARLTPVPSALAARSADRWAAARASFEAELTHCVRRRDGLLFHALAVDALQSAFIAWFARRGRFWPHEKRLSQRLRDLGYEHLADLEARVWRADELEVAHRALVELFDEIER